MKRFFIILIFIITIFSFPSSILASEAINSFNSNIRINTDGTVNVVETIVYDFDGESRRGIFREIPYIYTNQDKKEFEVGLDVESVVDQDGRSYNYKVTREDGNVVIRVGKEDVYITGVHTYVITYQLRGVITYFSDHDELYWNVTGNNWNVPIMKSSANILLNFNNNQTPKVTCFEFCDVDIVDNLNINISSTESFTPGEGLTFVVGFPKNLVAVLEPKEVISFWDTTLGKITAVFIALVAFLYYVVSPFLIFVLWYRFGRDPKTAKAVRSWFDPPKDSHGVPLRPAEVGTLTDEHADQKDISATIVDLAIRGFLKIKEKQKGKEYELIKILNNNLNHLNKYEQILLNGLFKKGNTTSTKDLKTSFYITAEEIEKELYEDLVKRGFFPNNPKKVRDKYYILGVLAFITGNIFLGIMLFVFGRIMPRKTVYGSLSQNVALGLKNFLGSQTRQLEFQAKNWYMFEKLLPFAIVFGVEEIWAKRFKDIHAVPPSWYEGSNGGSSFNSYIFVNSLGQATRSFSSLSTPPSSTRSSSGFSSGFSGGSSGGGFGGGGGGSW